MAIKPEAELDRRPILQRATTWAKAMARLCAEADISPNAISVFGLAVAVLAGLGFALTSVFPEQDRLLLIAGAALIPARLLANMLDGMVAVEWGRATRAGVLFNEAPDRLADMAILIGAGYANGGDPTLGYLAACTALLVAYVRTLASKAGAPSDFRGPMAKGHRMITVTFAALYAAIAPPSWQPSWGPEQEWGVFAIALTVICVGGIATAARRLRTAVRYLNGLPDPD